MSEFKAPLDDILVCLRDVARADRLPDWDEDMAQEILHHFAQFAEGVIAPLNGVGDAQGCRLHQGRVQMPDGFAQAFAQLADGGWQGLTVPQSYGGMAQNAVLAGAVSEIFSGANHALQMLCNLVPGAVSTLMKFGTSAQQKTWIPKLCSGQWLSTMCLTEPEAGSDLSGIRTRARQTDMGWQITGEKIFISGGDQDMSQGILHLVLARTGLVEDGIRGLSLFLCPSHTEAGRNGITVTRIEEKLGLHGSPTCHLAFDGADAQLIGSQGAGLMAMFTMMNHARLDVALQGVAHAARAHHIAVDYATQRQQGRKPDGLPAMLIDHADVRAMLDRQRALSLGARAMAYLTLTELSLGDAPAVVDFLTPICKVFCTQAGIEAADLGMQIMGGYGYLTEYRISQTWRDARITAIYEGANGVHALSLATRGVRSGEGADGFSALIADLAQGDHDCIRLLSIWSKLRRKITDTPDLAPGYAHDFMTLSGDVFFRALWVRLSHTGGEEMARLAAQVACRPDVIRPDRAA
ncbi:acyl-CoA dehydrogenase [Thioclava sp. SK-1]|uniref:acyl-CoA dehydrogenase family protein n=1 Tax=Thioclava sp. SK-1 TaxID=1889770 RepID=UPI000825DBDA|nr:acyl-CoA dehydrogenase family protein [Thioclava sp. SK-1]OCX67349.1 acyl-CoA dehydrogenase [Thioclava sp. SK-1]